MEPHLFIPQFSLRGIRDSFIHYLTEEVDNSDAFYKAILSNNAAGFNSDQLAYNVLGLAAGSVANFATGNNFTRQRESVLILKLLPATTLVLDFYLDEKRANEKAEIMALSMDNTPQASARLSGYAREALRLHPQVKRVLLLCLYS